ncbi:hypothetical protein H8E52_00265 [bacterium]|nr:hypothetical protein [bacterium]
MKLERRHLLPITAMTLLILSQACSERNLAGLDVARAKIDPIVFIDDLGEDVYPQAFSGTDFYAMSLDSIYTYDGSRSLKISIPPQGSSLGAYAGGVLTSVASRDMADYNALTLYARSSINSTLNVLGFGNDNTGTSKYDASRANIPLTPEWTFIVIPIPAPSKMISERGLLTYAEGFESSAPEGHDIWFDEIKFANLSNITDPFSIMPSSMKQYFVGATADIGGTYTRFSVDGGFVIVNHEPAYYDFSSTDPGVAIVDGDLIRIVGEGNAVISATMEGVPVAGSVTLSGFAPPEHPATPPTIPAQDVISLLSDVYNSIPVDSWNPYWGGSTTEVEDFVIEGDNMKAYSSLNWVGIIFTSNTVDASEMTHIHLDVFAPQGTSFNVKLVAFDGDNGNFLEEKELTFNEGTEPPFGPGQWSSLEIPLEDFQLSAPLNHLGQLVLSTSDARLVLVDNIYWHK